MGFFFPTRTRHTLSVAETLYVFYSLSSVPLLCVLRVAGPVSKMVSQQEKAFLCAPFWSVQICDYSAA
jgi:hypothetical protein